MMDSKEEQYFNGVGSPPRQNNEGLEKGIIDNTGVIPIRYQDGLGGIDIEQVRRDQQQAKREFIRAILKYLRRQH
ncbi:hypothetical protein [Halomonas sp. SpR8]|uniref:hypothetical protein n=1 Tax=Halomonas sp. SpR8 TaxID=3050463 RepID=UPI0027E4DC30|nr:hypothetical protein [Halomonas sp. SpR8]MDQ7729833.1 hypothetical protein [Halomonas sp. SpR8]